MTLLERITSYTEAFLRLIYPADCAVCEVPLEIDEHGICAPCFSRLRALRYPVEEAMIDEPFRALDNAWCLYPYASPLKEILTSIKFSRKQWLIRLFREEVKPLIQAVTSDNGYDWILPIPLDRKKHLEREFNQSEGMARLMTAASGIPSRPSLLYKCRSTPAQSQLSREERKTNLFRAFRVRRPAAIHGKNILLVDDIFTTGATAEEAARTLREAGARRVDLIALACTEAKKQEAVA